MIARNRKHQRFCPGDSSGSSIAGILFLILLSFSSIQAREVIRITGKGPFPVTGKNLDILKMDTGSERDLQKSISNRKNFFQVTGVPNFGFSDSSYVVLFTIRNETDESSRILEMSYTPMDRIELFKKSGEKLSLIYRTGDRFPFQARPREESSYLFPVTLPENEDVTYVMRFLSEGSYQLPLEIHTEWTLFKKYTSRYLYEGIYFGILTALLISHLILFLTTGDPGYFYYFLTGSGFGLIVMILRGLSYPSLWPNLPWWENHSLPFFIGWSFLWASKFSRSYLQTERCIPSMDRLLYYLMVAFFGLMVLSLFSYRPAIILSAFLVLAFSFLIFLTVSRIRQEDLEHTIYYLVAWSFFLAGTSLYAMMGLGFVPTTDWNNYSLELGSGFQMLLLSVGLGRSIRKLEREKETIQLSLTRLELELIKKNLEPHFLMNSINATVHWMEENPRMAIHLLHSLAGELRLLVEISGKTRIPVARELELCRLHLEVMELRKEQKFTLISDGLDPEEEIPPFTFHTIIENGITHGFFEDRDGVFRIRREILSRDRIRFVLENNGSSKPKKDRGTGLGTRYLESRLEECCPGNWKLKSGPFSGGWRTTMEIPRKSSRKISRRFSE